MRNAAGQVLGLTDFRWSGAEGGGYVVGIDVADDGTMVSTNDTTFGHVRAPGDAQWRQLLRVGITVPATDVTFRFPCHNSYAACIAATNSNIIYHSSAGHLFKSTNQGATSVRLMGYKSGALDPGMDFDHTNNAFRIGMQKMRVDPANPDVVILGHPLDGVYYTLDGGATWPLHPGLPAPATRRGVTVAFDRGSAVVGGRTQGVIVVIDGHGCFRSTTGLPGSFALVGTGGPTTANSVAISGNKIFVCGSGNNTDSPLHVWDGAAWSQPTVSGNPILGITVAARPNSQAIAVMDQAGKQVMSPDRGATWTLFGNLPTYIAEDIPWLQWTKQDYFSTGASTWHPTQNRLVATNGTGVWTQDNPPILSGDAVNPWRSVTLGIRQLISMSIEVTDNGRVHYSCHDRDVFSFDRDKVSASANRHAPNNQYALRHGTTVDYAPKNQDYLVTAFLTAGVNDPGITLAVSTDGGRGDWQYVLTTPKFAPPQETTSFFCGQIAVSAVGKFTWISSSDGGIKNTQDGGLTWATPNFAGVDISTAVHWHKNYSLRRRCIAASKDVPGLVYVYCVGNGLSDAADLAMRGVWKSVDHGQNYVRIRSTFFNSFGLDAWNGKLRLVPGKVGHLFWCAGPKGSWPEPLNSDDFWFSTDEGGAAQLMPGWTHVNDIALGANLPGSTYPALYVFGWRGAVNGLWRCTDFNPANRTGTWINLSEWPLGMGDEKMVLAADRSKFGRVYVGVENSGMMFADYKYTMRLSGT